MVRQRTLYLTLFFATFAVSWAAILIKLSGAGPLANAFYRMAIASAILILPFIPRAKQLTNLNSADRFLLVVSGIMLGLHFITWITSLFYTSISNSAILVALSPIFVLLIDFLILKQKPSAKAMIGIIIAIGGVFLITGGTIEFADDSVYGNYLALAGAAFVAVYLFIGRRLRSKIGNICYITPVYTIAAITILIAAWIKNENLIHFQLSAWIYFLLLALIPMLMGHSLYNWLLKHVPTHKVSTTTLGEPIGATILATIIFNEIPGWNTIAGGILVLVGIYLVLKPKKNT